MTDYELVGSIRRSLHAIRDHYDLALEPPRRPATKMPTEAAEGKIRYAPKVMKEAPAPINLDVLDARRDALLDVHFWARFVMGEVKDTDGRPLSVYVEGTNMAALCKFVDTWTDRLVTDHPDDAANCAEEVAKHAAKLTRYAYPDRRNWTPIGNCPALIADDDGNPDTCGAKVRAYEGSDTITCRRCGTEAELEWWTQHAAPERGDLANAADIIATVAWLTGETITNNQLWLWANRGHIQRHGKDLKGRTLYSSAAVAAWVRSKVKETAA